MRLQDFKDHTKQLESLLKSANEKASRYKERYLDMDAKNAQLRKKVNHIEKEYMELNNELQKSLESLEISKSDFRQAQRAVSRQSKPGWNPEEDGKLRGAIEELFRAVRTWSKAYAVSSFEKFQSSSKESQSAFFSSMKVADISDVKSLLRLKHPFLVLAAYLSNHILCNILFGPFFAFNNPPSFHTQLSYGVMLDHTFQDMFSDAYQRNVTVNPKLINEQSLHRILHDLTLAFVNGPTSLLMRDVGVDENYKRQSDLWKLLARATSVNALLQSQRLYFEWWSPTNFLETDFEVSSEFLKPDISLMLEDDEDDTHDGKPISIVISPCVVVYGDNTGSKYEESRVLARAVVCVHG
ncbi:hypothetical protein SLS56_008473 [Neofusicoccum ribis]|uniref:Uncharacterized protein n=1 Tax=Neofusicoccum ribis TaxID=45134 RepID=A0ABR3SKU5_9PEZI